MREGGRECLRTPYRESDARQIAGCVLCVCVCVMPCELGWEEEMERYDLHGKERKWQYELQAVFSCH